MFFVGSGGARMSGYDLGDRFLFWAADLTGASIDSLYAAPLVRLAMTFLRRSSAIFDISPR